MYRKYFVDFWSVFGFNLVWKEIIFLIVIVKFRGLKLWDIDGNELIDIFNGFGLILFGYLFDFIIEVVKV